jgi:hypothetical protein
MMTREDIAVSWRQLSLLMLLIVAPALFALLLIDTTSHPGTTAGSGSAAGLIAGVICTALAAAVAASMLTRRVVELSGDTLIFRLRLHGDARYPLLALSCSHKMAAAIRDRGAGP